MGDRRIPPPAAFRRSVRLPGRALLLAAAVGAACETDLVSVVEVAEVEVSPARITLAQGEQASATAILTADGVLLSGRTVTWSTDDPDIATVSPDGNVAGHTPGSTRLRASSAGVSGSAEVVVLAGPDIEISSETVELEADEKDSGELTREVGIENSGNGILDGLTAKALGKDGGAVGWLEVELAGTTAPTRLRLRASAENLQEGVYEARVLVDASSAMNGAAELRVRLKVSEREESERDQKPGSCEFRDRTIEGDVEIPRNTTCAFVNVRVRGDLELERGARLIASLLRVDGKLKGKDAAEVELTRSRILGEMKLEKGGSIVIRDSRVEGKVEMKSNRGRIELRDNTLRSDLELEDNRGGPFLLLRNTIDGKLECKGNKPSPTGGGNVARDGSRGQCRGL